MEAKKLRYNIAENFEEVLCSIFRFERHQYELVFPAGMIEGICKQHQYPCYKFAHNLEGESYMRAMVNTVTLEFLVRNKKDSHNEKESVILKVRNNGEIVYSRPEKATGSFYVI